MESTTPDGLPAADPASWNAERAAHLLRRAGFGGTPDQIADLVRIGFVAAVDRLVDFPLDDAELDSMIDQKGSDLDPPVQGDNVTSAFDRMRRTWIFRMARSAQPLREKLALFWHDHFACQASKVVRPILMQQQLDLFRRFAAGSFRDLLHAIARDPAMLVFLDNRISVAENPNENWARELMELFSLGLDRYTQRDIVELARVFTGWTTPRDDSPEFVFDAAIHDPGDKVLFDVPLAGRADSAGIDEGTEAIDRILTRPECAQFIAGKLAVWLVHPQPDAGKVDALAAVLVASDYSIRAMLRALFRSEWFYAPEHRFALYQNPVELVVGSARRLAIQNPHLAGLERHARRMGMDLLSPPSVAGWDHGDAWINSSATVARLQVALELSELPHTRREVAGRPAIDLDAIAGQEGDALDLATLAGSVTKRLLMRPLEPERAQALLAYAEDVAARSAGEPPARVRRAVTRGLIHLVMSSPEYALA